MNPLSAENLRVRLETEPLLPPATGAPNESKPPAIPFKDVLRGLVDQVDSLQKEADASIEGLLSGETTSVHDVVVKMEEAGIAFDLMMQIRNKLLEAYQQILKMQA